MVDPSLVLPSPNPDDGDDVVLALETAATLGKRGDVQDAIRWLRRAAEAAEEAGNDMRALALARTAAELTSATERKPAGTEKKALPTPPGSSPFAARSPAPDPDPAVAAALQTRGARPMPTPPPPPTASVSRPPPPSTMSRPPAAGSRPPQAAQSSSITPAATRLPTPPGAGFEVTPTPRSVAPNPERTAATSAVSPGAPPKSTPQASRSPRTASDALSDLMRADGVPGKSGRATSPTSLGALRVSVRRSPEDDRLLIVRLLGPDEAAPRGEKNAMLVATEIIVDQLIPSE